MDRLMDKEEAAKILKEHNEYRTWKGDLDKSPPMTNIKKLTAAIDVAVKYLEDDNA